MLNNSSEQAKQKQVKEQPSRVNTQADPRTPETQRGFHPAASSLLARAARKTPGGFAPENMPVGSPSVPPATPGTPLPLLPLLLVPISNHAVGGLPPHSPSAAPRGPHRGRRGGPGPHLQVPGLALAPLHGRVNLHPEIARGHGRQVPGTPRTG